VPPPIIIAPEIQSDWLDKKKSIGASVIGARLIRQAACYAGAGEHGHRLRGLLPAGNRKPQLDDHGGGRLASRAAAGTPHSGLWLGAKAG
jgi:hypothetical protein